MLAIRHQCVVGGLYVALGDGCSFQRSTAQIAALLAAAGGNTTRVAEALKTQLANALPGLDRQAVTLTLNAEGVVTEFWVSDVEEP